jgi:putative phage-type endonuclease
MDLSEHCEVVGRTDTVLEDDAELERWHEMRAKGIGGSDVAAIMETSRYKSRFSLWAEKTGRERSDRSTRATNWGHRLERTIAEAYAEAYGVAVYNWPVMLRSTAFTFMLANLDFVICIDPLGVGCVTDWLEETPPPNVVSILEIKTGAITSRGSTYEWEDDGVPYNYALQGLHYCAVTGIDNVVFAALIGGTDIERDDAGLVVRHRIYDETDVAELEEKEFSFWEFVERDEPPEPDGSPATFAALKAMYPNSVEGKSIAMTREELSVYYDWHEAKALSDETDAIAKKLYAKLALMVGEAEALTWNGKTLVTYKKTKDGVSVDTKALLADHPELKEQYEIQKSGHRMMLDKAKREIVE